ncbi:EcoAI/FtnUII family type I restriction enzme subunit R [Anabaena sp. FACHB-709]|uniref:Type I restriction-modification enzyme R subunit n=6 Tax=Nostocaceae TaxID=1162 RepID=A0A1Z4KJE0_ANAVA|nr:DEAD/DEAH box helicase family protein [Nostoc sp. PCC 7120 = FACHB-418]BAB75172.1 type I restriction-modification enzyme R subunit [Nostoc sp. PCC 7120 = FACHB-418]BAY69101.1 type I restriction-modification enzyme R subunit [Trichormus variabilis NIES-23]
MSEAIDKKSLSERDICTKYITPALVNRGWNINTQIREEVTLTKGRVIVRGKLTSRGEQKRADYVLYHKPGVPLAVIEAKDNNHSVSAGMQQAIATGELIDVPFIFSSNGDAFMMCDCTVTDGQREREIPLDQFPTPEKLWQKYCDWKGIDTDIQPIVSQDYYPSPDKKQPRYYQQIAINRTIEAIAKGENRILLVMATGTGKTFTAFQIIWRLWKSGAKKRILFLADRNILVDQTRVNDFKPFGSKMTKIKQRQIDTSYEIYLCLYQAVTGNEEAKNIYRQFSPGFFDLIIIDECHRGSASEDSAWRDILAYFSSATQIGLTATPRETEEVSNSLYFGDSIFTYSLKQGIEDGFLAPYKVIRIDFDTDLSGWKPKPGQRDKYGKEIPDQVFNQRDFDRTLVLEKRTELVARIISDYLKSSDRFAKTIVFCETTDHAERMRVALVNENADLMAENSRYIMRITGDDAQGKAELDNFIDPESKYPTIVTTSELLTTGVDAKTCKLIVLDQRILSMTKFKQIVGRGTRIDEDYGKMFFTIIDFKKATQLFADPEFDGEPVQIYQPKPVDPIVPPDNGDDEVIIDGEITRKQKREKYVIADEEVSVAFIREQYHGKDGKLITESIKDYTRKTVSQEYASLDAFLKKWHSTEQKQAIIQELQELGVPLEALEKEIGKGFDPLDLICHVVFDQPPLTRKERANNVRKRNYFSKYSEQARKVIDALLDKYADEGIEDIEKLDVLKVHPFDKVGTPIEIIQLFGSRKEYLNVLQQLKTQLYEIA